jgi:hypothetical protein
MWHGRASLSGMAGSSPAMTILLVFRDLRALERTSQGMLASFPIENGNLLLIVIFSIATYECRLVGGKFFPIIGK